VLEGVRLVEVAAVVAAAVAAVAAAVAVEERRACY
jgi:hypothetical protein